MFRLRLFYLGVSLRLTGGVLSSVVKCLGNRYTWACLNALLLSGKPSLFVMMSKREFLDPYEGRKLTLFIYSISGPTAEPNAAKRVWVGDCPV